MIENEMANIQKCLHYDSSPIPERVEHSKLKRPTVAQPTGSRGQNTSTDQTRRILQNAKLELGQILQSQVCERSPREQRMTEAAFLTIGNRSRTREKSFGKSKNQTVAQPTGNRHVSTDPTGSRKPTGSRSVSTDPTGSRSSSTDQNGSRSSSTDQNGSRSVSTYQTGCRGQNPSTDHMRRLLQNAKLDLVQILKRSTSVP